METYGRRRIAHVSFSKFDMPISTCSSLHAGEPESYKASEVRRGLCDRYAHCLVESHSLWSAYSYPSIAREAFGECGALLQVYKRTTTAFQCRIVAHGTLSGMPVYINHSEATVQDPFC